MQLSKSTASGVIVIAMAIAIASLAYPSTATPIASTVTSAKTDSYTSGYTSVYTRTTATNQYLIPYSTLTAWWPGDPICDPASMACTPYATPTATYTYSSTSTYVWKVATTSVSFDTYSSVHTVLSTRTSYQNLPVYAALGISDLQFAFVAILIIGAGVLGLFLARRNITRPRTEMSSMRDGAVKEQSVTSKTVASRGKHCRFCTNCGSELPVDSRFCGRCGMKML